MKKIRVLVVDHCAVCREGLQKLLQKEEGMRCVAVTANGKDAVKLTSELAPDIVLIDVATLPEDGVESVRCIMKACPTTVVVILTESKSRRLIVDCLQAGIGGYLLKKTDIADLMRNIRVAYAPATVFSAEATAQIIRSISPSDHTATPLQGSLNQRELEMLRLAATGTNNKEIATKLGVSDNTVAARFSKIYRKLGVQSRAEAVSHCLKQGWFI